MAERLLPMPVVRRIHRLMTPFVHRRVICPHRQKFAAFASSVLVRPRVWPQIESLKLSAPVRWTAVYRDAEEAFTWTTIVNLILIFPNLSNLTLLMNGLPKSIMANTIDLYYAIQQRTWKRHVLHCLSQPSLDSQAPLDINKLFKALQPSPFSPRRLLLSADLSLFPLAEPLLPLLRLTRLRLAKMDVTEAQLTRLISLAPVVTEMELNGCNAMLGPATL